MFAVLETDYYDRYEFSDMQKYDSSQRNAV